MVPVCQIEIIKKTIFVMLKTVKKLAERGFIERKRDIRDNFQSNCWKHSLPGKDTLCQRLLIIASKFIVVIIIATMVIVIMVITTIVIIIMVITSTGSARNKSSSPTPSGSRLMARWAPLLYTIRANRRVARKYFARRKRRKMSNEFLIRN